MNSTAKRPKEGYPPKKCADAQWRIGAGYMDLRPKAQTQQATETSRRHPATDATPISIGQANDLIAASRLSRIFSPIAAPTSP